MFIYSLKPKAKLKTVCTVNVGGEGFMAVPMFCAQMLREVFDPGILVSVLFSLFYHLRLGRII